MALPISVPYSFANATTSIPLSQLDTDISTVYAAVNGIGNGTVALSNVSITGGNGTFTTITSPASTNLTIQSASTTALTIDTSQNVTAAGTVAMASSFKRNRIINGNMLIDQRNAGASVTVTANTFGVDRFFLISDASSKYSAQQNAGSVTPPSGFTNYQGITSLSAYSATAGQAFLCGQIIEGLNISDLGWGSANAQTVTLSFWVRSSLTGTFAGGIENSGSARSYVFTYTISSANTWTYITITIPGDTSGTWLTNNGIGMRVGFDLGSGSNFNGTASAWQAGDKFRTSSSTSVVGTSGATFYITGVQLEVGTIATPYERQIYSDQLAQCQRYYEKSYAQGTVPGTASTQNGRRGTATNGVLSATAWYYSSPFVVTKRATPTVTIYATTTGNSGNVTQDDGSNAAGTVQNINDTSFEVTFGNGSGRFGGWFHYVGSAEL